MALSRIIYFSESTLDPSEREARIALLRKVALSRNRRLHLTGALVYDNHWFAQALEGELQHVEEIFERISRDKRHTNIRVASKTIVSERLFGNWAMGFAERSLENERLFGRHWFNATRSPSLMSEKSLLKLMLGLGKRGFIA
jgi:hypothetical protein